MKIISKITSPVAKQIGPGPDAELTRTELLGQIEDYLQENAGSTKPPNADLARFMDFLRSGK